jgi:hypothetical protein
MSLVLANRRVRRSERCSGNRNAQFDSEMAAPVMRMRTLTGTGAAAPQECEWKQGESAVWEQGRTQDISAPPVGRQWAVSVDGETESLKRAEEFVRLPLVGHRLYRLAGETESLKGAEEFSAPPVGRRWVVSVG